MSIRLMTLVWDIRWPTQNHLLVMLKLADHANDEGGKVWPAVSTISAQAQCSERTVQNVLKAFRDCGLVSVVKQGGGTNPTVYGLNVGLLKGLVGRTLEGCADRIEIPDDVSEDTGATIAPLPVAPVQTEAGRGATIAGEGCKAFAPKPPSKPSKEPPRACAREGEISDLGSEVKRALPMFEITSDCNQWEHWMVFLRSKDRQDLEQRARASGLITVVGARWPRDDSPLPIIRGGELTEKSKRMTGDAA